MTPDRIFSVGDRVLWANGVEGRVAAVDGTQIMDECGGWHEADDVEIAEVE